MFTWIAENAGTILIALALCAIVAGVIYAMAMDRRKGKSSCGGNCGHCPMCGSCRKR